MNLSIGVADADGIEVNECQRSNAAVESNLRAQREREVRAQFCVFVLAKRTQTGSEQTHCEPLDIVFRYTPSGKCFNCPTAHTAKTYYANMSLS
jgi:hypothetical protein